MTERDYGKRYSEDQFEVIRPVKYFDHYEDESLVYGTWFEKAKPGVWQTTISFTDLSYSRYTMANMLLEACNEKKFFDEWGDNKNSTPDDLDRLYLISWIQHVATISGILTAEEVYEIKSRAYQLENSIGSRQSIKDLPLKFKPKTEFDNRLEKSYPKVKLNLQKKDKEIVRGMFLGSFDPPHVFHLAPATYYMQYCHELVIGLDSDKFIENTKMPHREKDRKTFGIDKRISVWKNFPHLYSHLLQLPIDDLTEADILYPKIYRELGIDIVFLNEFDVNLERRIKQIEAGGAKPFVSGMSDTANSFMSSTELTHRASQGKSIDVL